MEPKTKSKVIVAVLYQQPSVDAFQEVQFAFNFIPSNLNFRSNEMQTVHVWRGPSRYTFMRVVSTDKTKTSFDVLYSGRVEQGSRTYLTPSVNSLQYVEALYQLGSITKGVFDAHAEEVRRMYVFDQRHKAERDFDKMLCRIGLELNKTQMAKVAKYFSALDIKL